jgi:beta-lactamase superfamily II metal-dependent hydrolase
VTCTISFLPVGNADSIVIQTDDSMIVVDLGNLSVLEKWIEQHQIAKIDRIYLTHDHQDHCPKLIKLIDFINDCKSSIKIEKVHFPYLYIYAAQKEVISAQDQSKVERLRFALKRIREWKLNHSPIFANGEIYSETKLKIEALHPEQNYVETHLAAKNSRSNEISVVLRVVYGEFSAILLADIEGDGLTELLQLQTDFTADLVKIPHHGAWPKNGEDLKTLLEFIDPEIAVLSVGSQNKYGHVKPELFDALTSLKNDSSKRLSQFICTEVTRTCKYSASEMDKKGLSSTEKCAGEITITAEDSGKWTLKTETKHSDVVKNFNYAACTEGADLI